MAKKKVPWARLDADPESLTLQEAKDWVEEAARDGAVCPCCSKKVKIYKRKMYHPLARTLIALHRFTEPGEWVHLFRFCQEREIQHSDVPSLKHWQLLEEMDEDRADGNPRNGRYRITEWGRKYVTEEIPKVARHVLVFNDTRLRYVKDEMVSIREALGDQFDYDQLMNA
jgi:hypothetical protein